MSDPLDQLANLPTPPPPALGPQLEAELGSLAPVGTRRPMHRLAVLAVLSMIYGSALVLVLTLRKDMHELPMGWLAAVAVGWFLGFLVPSYLALVPRAGTMSPRWQVAAIAVAIAAVGFVTLGLMIHPMAPGLTANYGTERFFEGHTCLEIGLATALVPVVIGAIFLRGALPVGSRWIAAALGAAGGCLGGLVLHLHCHIGDGLHVGLIHGGVVILAAALSAAIVPRATRV